MSKLKDAFVKLSAGIAKSGAMIKIKKAFNKIPAAARWGILAVLILGIIGGSVAIYRNSQKSPETTDSGSSMQTAVARRSSIVITSSGSGTLIPHNEASAGFSTAGKITQVYVKVGDEVEAGQVLADMDSSTAISTYDTARLNYMNMISPAAIATAEQNVVTAKNNVYSKYNTLAYMISPKVVYYQNEVADTQEALAAAQEENAANPSDETQQKVSEAQGALDKAESLLEYAWGIYYTVYVPDTFAVTETDQRTGVVYAVTTTDSSGAEVPLIQAPSQTTIDGAQAAYDLAKANLEEAQIYLSVLKGEEIPEDATGSALGQLLNAKASYESAKRQFEGTQLSAPISGTIMSFSAQVGDEVGTATIVEISDLSQPYYLEAYFDESDWTNIQVGYEADVTFDLMPDDVFAGKVVEVTPGLVSAGGSGLVHCYVELTDNVTNGLPSGTAATVEVVAGRATNVVTVPMEAIREISPGQYAVFVVEDGKPKLRVVQVGLSDITTSEITSGLEEGEVVTTGIVETLP